jgi:hypothetical protein
MKQVWISQGNAAPIDLAVYVEWLRPIPWQLFCTFTFAWSVSDQQAVKVFQEFVNRLERLMHYPIVLIRGDEKRFSGCGMPGAPRHFHALMTSHIQLDSYFVSALWMSMAGQREDGAGADVRIYDPNMGGLAYVLKFLNDPLGDWDFRNLDLFLANFRSEEMKHRQRRRLARHQKRTDVNAERTAGAR